jgi:hypothetical protein
MGYPVVACRRVAFKEAPGLYVLQCMGWHGRMQPMERQNGLR